MKRKNPRGPVPSLIGGANGRPERVTVGKSSNCYRCNFHFSKGDTCIAIPQVGSAFSNKKRVCDECFAAILDKTKSDLLEVEAI